MLHVVARVLVYLLYPHKYTNTYVLLKVYISLINFDIIWSSYLDKGGYWALN